MPPAPRGVPQIEVTFDIDANGIVNVSAKDLGTGKEQQITISGSGGLDDSDIDQMVSDAEAHAEDDKNRRAKVEARNSLDSLIYTTEKTLAENGDKLDAEAKSELESAIEKAKGAVDSDDLETLEAASQELMQSSHKLAEAMYQQAGAQAGAPGAEPGAEATADASASAPDEEVIDAEYVDVDETAAK